MEKILGLKCRETGRKYEKKELAGLANITALTLSRGTKKGMHFRLKN